MRVTHPFLSCPLPSILSVRELRTLLTLISELPIDMDDVKNLEELLKSCDTNYTGPRPHVTPRDYEMLYDSSLVSARLVPRPFIVATPLYCGPTPLCGHNPLLWPQPSTVTVATPSSHYCHTSFTYLHPFLSHPLPCPFPVATPMTTPLSCSPL